MAQLDRRFAATQLISIGHRNVNVQLSRLEEAPRPRALQPHQSPLPLSERASEPLQRVRRRTRGVADCTLTLSSATSLFILADLRAARANTVDKGVPNAAVSRHATSILSLRMRLALCVASNEARFCREMGL